jgi:putative transposase
MSYDELKKLKSLEVENRKLKHIYTGLNLDLQLVREIIEKKLYD